MLDPENGVSIDRRPHFSLSQFPDRQTEREAKKRAIQTGRKTAPRLASYVKNVSHALVRHEDDAVINDADKRANCERVSVCVRERMQAFYVCLDSCVESCGSSLSSHPSFSPAFRLPPFYCLKTLSMPGSASPALMMEEECIDGQLHVMESQNSDHQTERREKKRDSECSADLDPDPQYIPEYERTSGAVPASFYGLPDDPVSPLTLQTVSDLTAKGDGDPLFIVHQNR